MSTVANSLMRHLSESSAAATPFSSPSEPHLPAPSLARPQASAINEKRNFNKNKDASFLPSPPPYSARRTKMHRGVQKK